MSELDQARALTKDLDALIDRYRNEFEITYSTVVGCLTIKAWRMSKESQEENDED